MTVTFVLFQLSLASIGMCSMVNRHFSQTGTPAQSRFLLAKTIYSSAIYSDNGELLISDALSKSIIRFSTSQGAEDSRLKFKGSPLPVNWLGQPVRISSKELIVPDVQGGYIVVLDNDYKLVETLGTPGHAEGQFDSPSQAVMDNSGCFYVADKNNHRIQKFDKNRRFVLSFGSYGRGDAQLRFPSGITYSNNQIYVSDYLNNRLSVYDTDGTFIRVIDLSLSTINATHPTYLMADTIGNVWGIFDGNKRVVGLTSKGDMIASFDLLTLFQSEPPVISGLTAIGNMICVSELYSGRIFLFDLTGTYISELFMGDLQSKLFLPHKAIVTSKNEIWIADSGNHRIAIFTKQGAFLRALGSRGSGTQEFQYPTSIAVRPDGLIAVSDTGNHRIVLYDSNGTYVKTLVSYSDTPPYWQLDPLEIDLNFPTDISFAPDGDLLVADTNNSRLRKYNVDSGPVLSFGVLGSKPGQFSFPESITMLPSGEFLVADTQNHRIQKLSSGGEPLAAFGSFGNSPLDLNEPSSVAIDDNGVVVVSDRGHGAIKLFNPQGMFLDQILTFGKRQSQIGMPEYFSFWPSSSLNIMDSLYSNILTITSPYDFRAPTSKAILSSLAEWSNEDVTLEVTATDGKTGSGVRSISIIQNGKTVVQKSDDEVSYEVSKTGVHEVSFYAQDNANNVESAKSVTIKIDKVMPVTRCVKTSMGITLSTIDVHSGVRETWYKIDNGSAKLYAGPLGLTGKTIKFWSLDNAGNQESPKSMSL